MSKFACSMCVVLRHVLLVLHVCEHGVDKQIHALLDGYMKRWIHRKCSLLELLPPPGSRNLKIRRGREETRTRGKKKNENVKNS